MNWYGFHKVASSKGIVSFDFDSTLTKPEYHADLGYWVSSGPNELIIAEMRKLYDEGYQVIIVTSRIDRDMDEVRDFVKSYDLPVSGIYNTNGELKGPLLETLGVMKHYDDDSAEIESAQEYNVDAERVLHPADLENSI